MSRTIICTTGTSIDAGRPFSGDSDAYRREIQSRLTDVAANCSDDAEFLARASAETNSLASLAAGPDDLVLLLCTETPDGAVCAEEVARLLEKRRNVTAQILRVDGLQVADVTRFRRVGMQSLFQLLDRNTQDSLNRGDEVILNVTGGFKSVVPYVTLFGLLHQLPVVYLFERSRSLLRLPPVPVAFDYERLGQAIDAMRLLENEVIPREAFFAAIPGLEYHRRDWYECLIEEDEGLVTLSAFGSLLLRQRLAEQAEVWIGPGAQRQYAAAGGTTKDQFTFMLDRVADPLWRKAKTHAFAGTDLTVFKPGNTSERMAAIVRDGRIYVCELLQHDEYERTLPGRRAEQYALKEFRPWTRPADAPEPPATEEQAYRDLLTSLDSARAQLESSRSECTRVSAGVAAAEQDLVKANAEAQDLRRESEELRRQVRSLQADLAEARRPWWKVLLRLR